jgi:peptide/nickel transport system permease protein
MIAYIVRRLFSTLVVMAVVAFVVFSLLYLTPGDPAAIIAGDIATADDTRRIPARQGHHDPLLLHFARWQWSLYHGNLAT